MLLLSWLELTMSCRWQCAAPSALSSPATKPYGDRLATSVSDNPSLSGRGRGRCLFGVQLNHVTLDDKAGYRSIEPFCRPDVYLATDLTITKSVSTDGAASHFEATCDHA